MGQKEQSLHADSCQARSGLHAEVMNQTHGLERPGAHESVVTGNHIYEKTSRRDSDDPRRRRGGRHSRQRASSFSQRIFDRYTAAVLGTFEVMGIGR